MTLHAEIGKPSPADTSEKQHTHPPLRKEIQMPKGSTETSSLIHNHLASNWIAVLASFSLTEM
jgi:hypothetical protein